MLWKKNTEILLRILIRLEMLKIKNENHMKGIKRERKEKGVKIMVVRNQ